MPKIKEQVANRLNTGFVGIPSFLRAPICTDNSQLEGAIAVIGFRSTRAHRSFRALAKALELYASTLCDSGHRPEGFTKPRRKRCISNTNCRII